MSSKKKYKKIFATPLYRSTRIYILIIGIVIILLVLFGKLLIGTGSPQNGEVTSTTPINSQISPF